MKKMIQVTAQVPTDVSEFLLQVAAKNDRSLSWVVRYALQQWVAGQKK